ncbi:MAG: porin [Curvibacter sp. GWA2_64_110]|nr:MAG: porin [Curvibacter sp. GWA2_64_110]HCY17156.1 carbohydrate porin [Curvibacter sp.]
MTCSVISAHSRSLLLACAALLAVPAWAAPSQEELLQLLTKLSQRLDQLEKRNSELEKQLQAQPARAPASALPAPALEQRVQQLEQAQVKIDKGLESESISENEPELTSRLKAVEYQSLNTLKAARVIESLEGVTAGISLTTVAQHPNGTTVNAPAGTENGQLNYRADAFVTLPLPKVGDTESRIFAQFRMGQGSGLNGMTSYSKPNASAFRVLSAQPDDSVAVLGQAWYQASIPLPFGGFQPHSREKLEINFGKMDPFVFFDQNAAANDETRQFLNTVFVHNALLDAGGDIGVDANGFSPGFRVSYLNNRSKSEAWRLSLGVFGAGRGANYQQFFSAPLILAQAETQLRWDGNPGNYRLYYWQNGQAAGYDSVTRTRSGWGLSLDQRVGEATTLFGRYSQHIAGSGARFSRALTLGGELAGYGWGRAGDSVGLALGWLNTSSDFARDAISLTDYGFAPSGGEQVVELYYRLRINKQFELSPDFQYIGQPGAAPGAAPIALIGLRAQLTF